MLEHKEFLDNFCNSDKVEKLIEIGFAKEEGEDVLNSRTSAIAVLNTLVQLYLDRKTENEGEGRRPRGEFVFSNIAKNEDSALDSDGESLSQILAKHARTILESLEVQSQSEGIPTTFGVTIQPLGHLRLKIVELVYLLIKMGNKQINEIIPNTNVLSKISKLIEQHHWNNFLHLKVN